MYRIKLNEFEGPLDLLLFFIQRDELDINNIPISKITNEFCEYVHYMQVLDIEVASDFILMAATLIQIKAKMMLHSPEEEIAEELAEKQKREDALQKLIDKQLQEDEAAEIEDFSIVDTANPMNAILNKK